MGKKKISIGAWAYIWGGYQEAPIPLPEVLKRLKELKFDGVELAAFPPHLDPAEYNTRAKRLEIKKMLDDHGLAVSGLAANFSAVPPALVSPTQYIEVVMTNLDICHDLNIPKLRVDTISPPTEIPGGMDYETCFWRVAQVFHRAAEVCAREGVKLVWEFEPGFLFNKPSEVVRMVYAVDHPNFSVLFDSCHAYMCAVVGARQLGEKETLPGGVVQFAHMLTGKIGHVHFIDSDGTLHDDETSTHAPFGQGVLNFDEIVKALLEAGYTDEWWPIDLCFWPKALEATAGAKAFMDQLAAKFA
ncbi:MAG: sugar phosphate isomerase/epimerase [Ardenticatenia bacterium]|jgi:sugar phosphate isomerase/epimerase|nr:MAG: sugar phosphate isomerase/epimerase [Ardenticatenia bacterium]